MNKEELWDHYVKENPSFAPSPTTVTLTTIGLKKLFDQTWNVGYAEGKKSKSLFEEVFGKHGLR